MARGRKPTPIELRDAEGNLTRRPLPESLLQNQPITAEPPSFLQKAGRALWQEMVARLGSVGALDAVDRVALTALCIQWDLAEDARKTLARQGIVARGSNNQLVEHPAVRIMTRAHAALLKFCAEYGATPVARARVATAKAAAAAASEFEQIIDGEAEEVVDDEVELPDGDDL